MTTEVNRILETIPLKNICIFDENRQSIFNEIKRDLFVPKILVAEMEIILNAQKAIMESALKLLEIYKEKLVQLASRHQSVNKLIQSYQKHWTDKSKTQNHFTRVQGFIFAERYKSGKLDYMCN